MYFFPSLEPACCSMSSSNCCFLTCIQVSQETGQVVWYLHFFQNFPQFIVIHTVKGFDIVNKAEIDVSLELFCIFNDPMNVGNLISGSSAFSKSSLNIWRVMVHVLLKPGLENLSITLLTCEMSALIAEEGFLISPCYSLELCIQKGISFLFCFAFCFFSFLGYL